MMRRTAAHASSACGLLGRTARTTRRGHVALLQPPQHALQAAAPQLLPPGHCRRPRTHNPQHINGDATHMNNARAQSSPPPMQPAGRQHGPPLMPPNARWDQINDASSLFFRVLSLPLPQSSLSLPGLRRRGDMLASLHAAAECVCVWGGGGAGVRAWGRQCAGLPSISAQRAGLATAQRIGSIAPPRTCPGPAPRQEQCAPTSIGKLPAGLPPVPKSLRISTLVKGVPHRRPAAAPPHCHV